MPGGVPLLHSWLSSVVHLSQPPNADVVADLWTRHMGGPAGSRQLQPSLDQQPTCRQPGAEAHVNRLLGTLGPVHPQTPSPPNPTPHPPSQPAQLIRLDLWVQKDPPGKPPTRCHPSTAQPTTHPRVANQIETLLHQSSWVSAEPSTKAPPPTHTPAPGGCCLPPIPSTSTEYQPTSQRKQHWLHNTSCRAHAAPGLLTQGGVHCCCHPL